MANYNYVAPIEYKSYSEMNKERLAAKAERDALKVQQFSAGDKQRQKYLDQLSGLKTEGWSTLHRDEFMAEVEEARRYIQNTPINQVQFGPVSDAIIRMQGLGDSHAKLRTGQTEYETHFGVNAVDSEDNTWDATINYNREGWEKRLNTFNNVGLINYSNGRGDFPNPNYDPKAEPGTEGSFRSVREMLESQGATIETGPDGKDYANVNGQQVPVNGGAFDVADGGFGNLWNGDRKTRETHTPGDTYLNFKANENGASVFTALGNDYFKEVKNEGMTIDEAHDTLKNDVMLYLTGQDPSASLRASAIRMWEDKYNMEWEAMNEHIARSEAAGGDIPPIPETPWEMYAEAVADKAPFTPKPAGEDSDRNWSPQKRLWESMRTNRYHGVDTESTGRSMNLNKIKEPQWADMLTANLGDEFKGVRTGGSTDPLTYNNSIQTVKNNILGVDNPDGPMTDLYEGDGSLNITIAEKGLVYDGESINRVTYYPDEDYVIVWRVAPDGGDKGPLDETSKWAYTPITGGKAAALPFQVIYMHKDGKPNRMVDGNVVENVKSQQYSFLMANFASVLGQVSGSADPLGTLLDQAKARNFDF